MKGKTMEYDVNNLVDSLLLLKIASESKTNAKAIKFLCEELKISVMRAMEILMKVGTIMSEGQEEQ